MNQSDDLGSDTAGVADHDAQGHADLLEIASHSFTTLGVAHCLARYLFGDRREAVKIAFSIKKLRLYSKRLFPARIADFARADRHEAAARMRKPGREDAAARQGYAGDRRHAGNWP
jgi:hypothetical protein